MLLRLRRRVERGAGGLRPLGPIAEEFAAQSRTEHRRILDVLGVGHAAQRGCQSCHSNTVQSGWTLVTRASAGGYATGQGKRIAPSIAFRKKTEGGWTEFSVGGPVATVSPTQHKVRQNYTSNSCKR
ncbi:hypothetical protein SETIT_6G009200v2 [Setaria italica]|uniref:Uncharacterized protein n=1 Tax=Setaria italica TaxID=4555 RepID=A0A368RGQ1_SETIT|nr:hypothetical protein SETIT_6G009200v2 [Setaria italica]